jgi:Ras-related protein Rab-8A
LGASNAGKSRLFFRYTDNSYVEDNTVTIAPNLGLVKIKIGESFFKLQIWDVCGLERVQSITNSSYYGTHAYVLVFDLTDRESFFRLLELFQTILSYGSEGSSIIVVGAKSELVDLRAVLREEAEALAAGLGGPYIEISAKEDINVTEIFETLSKMVYLKQIEKNPAFLSSPLGRDLSDERIEVTRRKLEKIQDNKSAALIPHFSPIIRPAPKSPVAAVAARAPTPLSKTPTKSGARK